MSSTTDNPSEGAVLELDELQPMEGAAPGTAPSGAGGGTLAAGCVAPAFNPSADKEYYRFFFAGMVMLLGCLMPFGPEVGSAGYKSIRGAAYTLIAVGLLWSWWGAIATNRFSGQNLKWVFLAVIPLLLELMTLLNAFSVPAVADFIASEQGPIATSWGELFGALPNALMASDADSMRSVSNFFHHYGSGRLVVFVGALMAEAYFVLAIFSGAKEVQSQKKAKAAERTSARGGDKGKSGKRK